MSEDYKEEDKKMSFGKKLILAVASAAVAGTFLVLIALINNPKVQEDTQAGIRLFKSIGYLLCGNATMADEALETNGIFAVIDGESATLYPDPLFDNDSKPWQGKNSGLVMFDDSEIIYYGHVDNNSINGFGMYWIPLEDGDVIHLGRRINGRAQGPGIRVNSDGSYYVAIFDAGKPVSNRIDFYANGTIKE